MTVVLSDPYGDLRALLVRADRVCPRTASATRRAVVMLAKFSIENTVIEARSMGAWKLDPEQFPVCPASIPSVHKTTVSRRWFVRKHTACTQRMTAGADKGGITAEGGSTGFMPRDVRLWYPSDSARKLLLMGRRDLDLLFASQIQTLPCCDESKEAGTVTLFATPDYIRHSILYKDSIDVLSQHSPYLARLCDEYAHMMCWLYGLTIDEFGELAHLYITRHAAGFGKRTELLETSDNGRYTGGPFLSVGIGRPHLFHDFCPVLATSTRADKPLIPVRVGVGEGVLLVMDGYARIRYAHGHPATDEQTPYYTLNFQLDCMRRTLCTGVEKVTHGIVTYTPFIPEHVVSTSRDTVSAVSIRMDSCPTWSLLMEMHTRLKVAESHLLTRGHKPGGSCSEKTVPEEEEEGASPCPAEPEKSPPRLPHPAS